MLKDNSDAPSCQRCGLLGFMHLKTMVPPGTPRGRYVISSCLFIFVLYILLVVAANPMYKAHDHYAYNLYIYKGSKQKMIFIKKKKKHVLPAKPQKFGFAYPRNRRNQP